MEPLGFIKIFFLGTSCGTLFFSLIFLLFPDLYFSIEDMFDANVVPSAKFLTTVEGEINFLNDWIIKHRLIFGTLFVLLSLYNIKSLIVL